MRVRCLALGHNDRVCAQKMSRMCLDCKRVPGSWRFKLRGFVTWCIGGLANGRKFNWVRIGRVRIYW